MKLPEAGDVIDGFMLGERIHAGGMAHIFRVHYADGRPDPGFPMVMKVPRMASDDGAENIVSFEVELLILPELKGPHVPRFVAAGDLARLPYLVMEYVPGRTLQAWLDHDGKAGQPLDVATIARLGRATAAAAHHLHRQNAVHLDLKPANVLLRDRPGHQATSHAVAETPAANASATAERPELHAVLLDFGLSWHAHFPDLLAEELRLAVGSPAWIAPEQVVGVRGDPRSDVFAIGVMLYELATGELPYGEPVTQGGLRQRLWMAPRPPRQRRPDLPAWLQEVILRCLEPQADQRYPSAAHLAFDLGHPDQVTVGERGQRLQGPPWRRILARWVRAAGMQYQPSPMPARQIETVPIVMIAVPGAGASDLLMYSLRESAKRSLGLRPGARLACVTVLDPSEAERDEGDVHRRQLDRLQQWARAIDLAGHQLSCHVIESTQPASALVTYARSNHVTLLIVGMSSKSARLLQGSVPQRVVAEAPCSVLLVKPSAPFLLLGADAPDDDAAMGAAA